jgi:hypothetical protein
MYVAEIYDIENDRVFNIPPAALVSWENRLFKERNVFAPKFYLEVHPTQPDWQVMRRDPWETEGSLKGYTVFSKNGKVTEIQEWGRPIYITSFRWAD